MDINERYRRWVLDRAAREADPVHPWYDRSWSTIGASTVFGGIAVLFFLGRLAAGCAVLTIPVLGVVGRLIAGSPVPLLRMPVPVHRLVRAPDARRREATPEERAAHAAMRATVDRMLSAVTDEVTAVGELLAEVEVPLDSVDDVTRAAYTRALDSYDAAARLLDDVVDLVELAGVVTLAADARLALATAVCRHRHEPAPPVSRPCFYNPLHGRSDRTVDWRTGYKRTLKVPACPACRKAVRRHDEPAHLVDRTPDGRIVPYYAVDPAVSVWSATGYGTFHPDLAARIQRGEHRERRRRVRP